MCKNITSITIDPSIHYFDYGERVILSSIKTILQHQNDLCSKHSIFALHQLRVNTRRLRIALWIFKDVFPRQKLMQWDKRIKETARISSDARDLDVFIEFLRKYKNNLTMQYDLAEKLNHFIHLLEEKQQQKRPKIVQALEGIKRSGTLLDISCFFKDSLNQDSEVKEKNFYKIICKRIQKRIRDLLYYEKVIKHPKDVEGLHQLRIEIKHLRYTLECLDPLFGYELHPFIEIVLKFHRKLGIIHDYDVWQNYFLSGLTLKKNMNQVYKRLYKNIKSYCSTERRKILDQFVRDWDFAQNQRFFEELLSFIYAFKDFDIKDICPHECSLIS